MGETALKYAMEVEDFFKGKEIDTWERAFVFIVLARANKALSKTVLYEKYKEQAMQTIVRIEDAQDRAIVEDSMRSL